MEWQLPEYNLRMMAPEIFLFLWALAVMTFDLMTRRRTGTMVGYLSLGGLLITGLVLSTTGYGRGFTTMFFNDPVSLFFKIIFLGAAFLAIASSFGLTRQKIVNHRGEYFGLILLSTVGMMFLSSSNELLSLYIGLELTTIPLFVLAAFFKDDRLSVEAGIKYFVVGALSSALLLYGLSFLYGLTGTTGLLQMRINLALTHLGFQKMSWILLFALILVIAGIGFKLALPPFHQWAPDVYEGAPTPIAAFLSVGSKGAGVVAFAKIFVLGLAGYYGTEMAPNDWGWLAGILACLALIIGNVLAIRQTNIKRMLAYSSIAHAGYVMIGIVAMDALGITSVGFYIFAYLFANMGAFGVVAVFEEKSGSCQIASYRGLAKSSPLLSHSLTVFLLSLAGIPPLAGFLAKYYVFAAAIKVAGSEADYRWLYWLVGIGMLTAVFALYYYANVIKQMYFSTDSSPYKIRYSIPAMSVIIISLVGVVLFGLLPEPVLRLASQMSGVFALVPR